MPLATQHSYTSQVRVVPALAPALAAAQQSVAAAAAVVACSEAAPFALRVEAGSSTPDLDHELEVLKAIEGILLVNIMNGAVLNSMGINVSIRPLQPQSPRRRVRVVCSTSQPTVLLAAREAKRRITDMLGAEVVEAAERRVQARVEARVHPTSAAFERLRGRPRRFTTCIVVRRTGHIRRVRWATCMQRQNMAPHVQLQSNSTVCPAAVRHRTQAVSRKKMSGIVWEWGRKISPKIFAPAAGQGGACGALKNNSFGTKVRLHNDWTPTTVAEATGISGLIKTCKMSFLNPN
jgi:hypothetical protein